MLGLKKATKTQKSSAPFYQVEFFTNFKLNYCLTHLLVLYDLYAWDFSCLIFLFILAKYLQNKKTAPASYKKNTNFHSVS